MALKISNWFEKALFTVVLFLLTDKFNGFIGILSYNSLLQKTVSFFTGIHQKAVGPVIQAGLSSTLIVSLNIAVVYIVLMLVIRPGLFNKIVKAALATNLLTLLLFSCASWLWSIAPGATFDGLLLVLKITLVGVYLSQRYSAEEILDLLVAVIAIASVLSAFAIWLVPRQSIHLGGEWRGIYDWKNFLGRLMSFGNAILIVYWLQNQSLPKRIFALCLFLLTGILLLFSSSTTSQLILLAIYACFILYGAWMKWGGQFNNPSVKWWMVLGMLCIFLVAAWQYRFILALLNKPSALTGRMALWEILWGWFQKRPLFGFGYEAFWSQLPGGIQPPGPGWVDDAGRQTAHHAHNGYFDILLALGISGLLLFLWVLASCWKTAFVKLWQTKQVIWLWPVFALLYLTFANISYSVAFIFPDFHWALLVIVSGLAVSTQIDQAILRQPFLY